MIKKLELHDGIARLAKMKVTGQAHALEHHPFDRHLLSMSSLYRKSRELYLEIGGRYRSTLVSSPRTLSSPILLENLIEYTPLEHELVWAATDRIEKKNSKTLSDLKRYISSVYHEQNHRILWTMLPPAPKKPASLRRYLNFAEALVITADMALSDELGPELGALFHGIGVVYDPGTTVRCEAVTGKSAKAKRLYRNYLQACLHATYLNLEVFEPELIEKVIRSLYSNAEPFTLRAIERASHLNRGFVTRTNLVWQNRHRKRVIETLAKRSTQAPLVLEDDPLHNIQQYVLAECWFDRLGL